MAVNSPTSQWQGRKAGNFTPKGKQNPNVLKENLLSSVVQSF